MLAGGEEEKALGQGPGEKKSLKELKENEEKLKSRGLKMVEGRLEEGAYVMPFIRAKTGHAYLAETMGQLRCWAAYMINLSLDAVMLLNGKYLKRGVKRTFEELKGLDVPSDFEGDIICSTLTCLLIISFDFV